MTRSIIRLKRWPKFNRPIMVASWPGVGNVSLISSRFLREKLNPAALAFIDPLPFFTPSGIVVEKDIVQEPHFPRSIFYGIKSPRRKRDIILFIGDSQPVTKGYELAEIVAQAAEQMGVDTIITLAAALSPSYNIETPKVWAVASEEKVLEELKQVENLLFRGELHIAGLNGLLLGIAKMKNMRGICFLGEVPSHLTQVPYPKAAVAVLETLLPYLGMEVDLSDLRKTAQESEAEIKNLSQQAMSEYLENFTTPIWESGQETQEE